MTQKQEALKSKIIENCGKGKPLGETLREVGYSDNSANNPKRILEGAGIKNDKELAAALDAQIWRAVASMDEKLDKASYSDAVTAAEKLTKTKRLIQGESTDNNKLVIEWGAED